jgi:hypothetical protein
MGALLSSSRSRSPGTRHTRVAPRARQQIDVARELVRAMRDDVAIAVDRVADLDAASVDDEQIQVGIPRAKNRFAVLERANSRHGRERRELAGIKPRKRNVVR